MIVDPHVIIQSELYHWRDGANRPLCNKEIRHVKVEKYSAARRGRSLCKDCDEVVAEIARGLIGSR